ncbi:MAG: phosphoenolpyruvate--protein phosphotransferase [Calditrichaeota bacterium]|nr:phosphoenolpyruvate--protein phosphotransferase [Calditrichota bacterium]
MGEIRLSGIGVSPGIIIGPVQVRASDSLNVQPRSLRDNEVDAELRRFQGALDRTSKEIRKTLDQVANRMGTESAGIFEAHLLILQDPMLLEPVDGMIRTERVNADYALQQCLQILVKQFRGLKDEYLRQRATDLEDVGRRLIEQLQGRRRRKLRSSDVPFILVADDLSPSETAELDTDQVLALITEKGSLASHTTILCRSVGVPAIVGAEGVLTHVKDGDLAILDGSTGKIYVHPSVRTTKRFREARQVFKEFELALSEIQDAPAVTRDGHTIELSCNLELSSELDKVIRSGGRGVGLFRSEYLYLAARSMPSEKYQYREYVEAARAMHPHPLTIRTFDLGGDKQPAGMDFPSEANPFLGWRAIRVSLDRPRMFRTQLRAILRASELGNVRLMFPMISGTDELREALDVLESVKKELRESRISFDESMKVGIMVEVPSAVLCAPELARMVDFFSIGTNDLTQYLLAVDRNNKLVGHLFSSLNPAVLHSIALTVQAGRKAGIQVGMCGELAGDPSATMLLVGLGLDELSVSPVILPEIKMLIRSMSQKEARQLTRRIMALDSAEEIARTCQQCMRERFPSFPIWAENLLNHPVQ